jgi:hypothetical protein
MGGDDDVVEPPPPLEELSRAEGDEWRAIYAAVPPGYLPPATWPLVAQLCRHRVIERRLAQLIHREDTKRTGFSLDTYIQLVRESRATGAAIIVCLRSLRLTPLSSYQRDRSPLPEAPLPKPWLS